MIRVLIADDHALVRQGIRALLERTDDIQVIGEAENGQEAVNLVERFLPDVLLIDIGMPRLNGIQAAEIIHARGLPTRTIILTMYADQFLVHQALQTGVQGYLLKHALMEELLLAIRSAHRGEVYLSPSVTEMPISDLRTAGTSAIRSSLLDVLSTREREVLKLIAEGHTNNEVADLLTISVKTVEKHRASAMEKLNVHDLPGLVRIAVKHGLIFLEE